MLSAGRGFHVCFLAPAEPRLEADRRELRQLALRRYTDSSLRQRRKSARAPVGQAGGDAAVLREPGKESDRVGRQRAHAALVVMRQELGLESRHVDVDRALGLARLAREAQVERFLDALVPPPVAYQVPGQHLVQE